MKKLPKSIEKRINEINNLLLLTDQLGDFVYTYAGGTYPFYVDIQSIEIKDLKVVIKAKDPKRKNNLINIEKYNCKKIDEFALNGLVHLKYDLSIILKALKKALN